jgi:hypothetical protein
MGSFLPKKAKKKENNRKPRNDGWHTNDILIRNNPRGRGTLANSSETESNSSRRSDPHHNLSINQIFASSSPPSYQNSKHTQLHFPLPIPN